MLTGVKWIMLNQIGFDYCKHRLDILSLVLP